MKNDDINTALNKMDIPSVEPVRHHQELKIPLLSYTKSSRAGLWLLVLPVIVAITAILKYDAGISSPIPDGIRHFFSAIDRNPVLTYLVPLVVAGLPLLVMVMNFLAFCHFAQVKERKELLITIKYRPANIALFLFSFAILLYFLLPDRASF